MGLSDDSYNYAELRVSGLNGVRGIGMNRLQFSLELDVRRSPTSTSAVLSNPACHVYAALTQAQPAQPLGTAEIETSWFTETVDHPRREGLSVYLDLTGEQLDALERLRGGGSVFFKIDFRVIIKTERGLQHGDQQVWLEADLSTWSRVLGQLGYMDILLLGVELPLDDAAPALRGAIEQIRLAHRDVVAGRYDATVGRVRLAIDAIAAVVDSADRRNQVMAAFIGNAKSREGMSKRARADLIRVALKHYTNLAHHVDGDGNLETFSRQDALFLLTAAAGAIWDAIAELQTTPDGPASVNQRESD